MLQPSEHLCLVHKNNPNNTTPHQHTMLDNWVLL